MPRPLLVFGNRNYSSWSMRGWLALRHAGIAFDEERIALDVPGYRERILAHSPAGRVPVLHDGSITVWDSLAIAEYAAEQAPSLWPSDRAPRARARAVSAEMHAGFPSLRAELPMNIRARRRHTWSADAARDIERVCALWEACRTDFGAGGPWLFGDFSIADVMYAPVVMRFRTYDVALGETAARYRDAVCADRHVLHWCEAALAEHEIIAAEEVGEER